jgi:hypothetical protein
MGFKHQMQIFHYMWKKNREIVIIVIYVDDLIITRDTDVNISDLKKLLKQKFEMKDLGESCVTSSTLT